MKKLTTPTLPVNIGLDDFTLASRIDFVFKQYDSDSAPALVEKSWPEDCGLVDGIIYVPFTQVETALFEADKPFYMDTRIVLVNGSIPQTNKNVLYMNGTLFSEVAQ